MVAINSQSGFVYSGTDDLGNKKNKQKQQQQVVVADYGQFFTQPVQKQQLDASLADSIHVNGYNCWSCDARNYADCRTNGATAYCEGEQFHCFVHEKKQYGVVSELIMIAIGCQNLNSLF